MCAIAGFVDLKSTEAIRKNMTGTMVRRGPDDTGYYEDGACTLLHARLSVIDPAGGRQPMGTDWGAELYELVYNGELYKNLCR